MILGEEGKPSLEELAHHGVKGMRWGVKKNKPEPSLNDRIAKVERKQQKLNANQIIRGAELKGYYLQKGSKHPIGRGKAAIALMGATEVAVILGGGNAYLNRVRISEQNRKGAKISVVLLAGKAGHARIQELRSLTEFDKHQKLVAEREALVKERSRKK